MKVVTYDLLNQIIEIQHDNEYLYKIRFVEAHSNKQKDSFSNNVYSQLVEYLNSKRTSFDIPIKITGTDFQQKVYNYIINIKYGEFITYKDIANALDNPNSSRAVGNALNKNPILFIVPCHRIIGTDKKLGGYVNGVEFKQKLLDIEKGRNTK